MFDSTVPSLTPAQNGFPQVSRIKTSSNQQSADISLSKLYYLINTLQNSGNADYKKLAQTILDTGLRSKEEVEQCGLTSL